MQDHVTVDQWVNMFEQIGLDDAAMSRWHRNFESLYPGAHQSFLEWLGLPPEEVEKIRKKSR